jgi:hypothetical protein
VHKTIKTASILTMLGCIMLANTQQARAQTTAITGLSGGTTGVVVDNLTLGWEFTPNISISVTHLGVYDHQSNGFTSGPYPVGIFSIATGSLITSVATVTSSSVLDNSFRYEPIAPVTLFAGQQYRIGAYYNRLSDLIYVSGSFFNDANITVFSRPSVYQLGNFLTYPTISDGFTGYFGPNFKFTSTASAAPEPGTLALIAIGGMGLAFQLRRRK